MIYCIFLKPIKITKTRNIWYINFSSELRFWFSGLHNSYAIYLYIFQFTLVFAQNYGFSYSPCCDLQVILFAGNNWHGWATIVSVPLVLLHDDETLEPHKSQSAPFYGTAFLVSALRPNLCHSLRVTLPYTSFRFTSRKIPLSLCLVLWLRYKCTHSRVSPSLRAAPEDHASWSTILRR